jgi:O-antigen/teichoic acid export membrane protein
MDILKKNIEKLNTVLNHQTFYSMLSFIVYAGLEAAIILILARTFTKEIMGEWLLFYTGFFMLDRMTYGFHCSSLVRYLAGVKEERKAQNVIGSSWVIALIINSIFLIIMSAAFLIAKDMDIKTGFKILLILYPLIAFIRIPFNTSLAILQVKSQFKEIVALRLLGMGIFVLAILTNYVFFDFNFNQIVGIFIASNLIGSLYPIFKGWSGITDITRASVDTIKKLVNFGKFSMGTFLGATLLKDADVFLIGMFLTSQDVALYGIPLKLIDAINVPISAFVAIALPKMCRASHDGDNETVRQLFYKNTGSITLLFIPLLIGFAVFSQPFIYIFGGSQYIQTNEARNILLIFIIYGSILTIDRFSGVVLDSINRPDYNFYKVLFMVVFNILGDLIALVFFKSLIGVALATVLNALAGVIIGLYLINKEVNIKFMEMFHIGWISIFTKLRSFKSSVKGGFAK